MSLQKRHIHTHNMPQRRRAAVAPAAAARDAHVVPGRNSQKSARY